MGEVYNGVEYTFVLVNYDVVRLTADGRFPAKAEVRSQFSARTHPALPNYTNLTFTEEAVGSSVCTIST